MNTFSVTHLALPIAAWLASTLNANTAMPITSEAENAALGSMFTSATAGETSYITISQTFAENAPSSANTLEADQFEISLPIASHAFQGFVHVESSSDLEQWQRIGTYDLNVRTGQNFERIESLDGISLRFKIISQLDSQTTFYRYVYTLNNES